MGLNELRQIIHTIKLKERPVQPGSLLCGGDYDQCSSLVSSSTTFGGGRPCVGIVLRPGSKLKPFSAIIFLVLDPRVLRLTLFLPDKLEEEASSASYMATSTPIATSSLSSRLSVATIYEGIVTLMVSYTSETYSFMLCRSYNTVSPFTIIGQFAMAYSCLC